ncbi:MAG: helix-turn-helix domain-containing protein [Acidimicrobiia bacterium]|nr:helix-turn-helix domain-containing protein [Acidimicrobiia bacterium]
MSEGRLEFFVEPFSEGRPGPHVLAAIKAVEGQGFEVVVGPFGNVVTGSTEKLALAAEAMLREALTSGATRVSLQMSTDAAGGPLGVPILHDALERLIGQVENVLGGPLSELPREQKQAAVRMLDEQGAFLLRRSIDRVAEAVGVSRITIYNYLNAIRDAL